MLAADQATREPLRGQGIDVLRQAELETETTPENIGPYRIVDTLGTGGMGVVYEAEQAHPRRRIALKTLRSHLATGPVLDLFRFEAQAMAELLHAGIPQVYDAGEEDGRVFLAMELVRGEPLDEAAKGRTSRACIELVAMICDAVQHAHDGGILHRDLKPSNILVTRDGQPKVLDFGVATPLIASRAGRDGPIGTIAYMSPEQLDGAPIDARADVYALGVVLFELLVSRRPVAVPRHLGPAEAAKQKRAATISDPSLDADLTAILRRALEPDPDKRTPTAAALGEDLRRYLLHLPVAPAGVVHRARLWSRRHTELSRAIVVSTLLVILGAGAWLGYGAYDERRRRTDAEKHWSAAAEEIEHLQSIGRRTEAATVFRLFTEDPQHRGTPALAKAWLAMGERRWANGDYDGALPAYAEAYAASTDTPTERLALKKLADPLRRDARWGSLARIAELVPDTPQLAYAAAVGQRAFERAKEVVTPEHEAEAGMLDALAKTTPTPFSPANAKIIQWNGEPHLLLIGRDEIVRIATIPAFEVIHALPHPHQSTSVHAKCMATIGDRLLLLAQTSDGPEPGTHLWEMTGDTWTKRADAPSSVCGGMIASDLDGDGAAELYAGFEYPVRTLLRFDPTRWTSSEPHPATNALDSAISALTAADLDGDDRPELVVAATAWNAFEVRTLGRRNDALALLGRQRLGAVDAVGVVPGDTPIIVAGKADQTPSIDQFPPETPFGAPAGLYLFRQTDEGLERLRHLPVPIADTVDRGNEINSLYIGDFDGDGSADVAVELIRFAAERHVWIAADVTGRPTALRIAGWRPLGVVDMDRDGDDELLVIDETNKLYFVGAGESPSPRWKDPDLGSSAPLGEPPSADVSVRRSWGRAQELLGLGFPREAASILAALAAQQPGEAADAIRLAAARLYESIGADNEAAALFERVPNRAEARRGRARTAARRIDFAAAAAAASQLDAPDLAWMTAANDAPVVDVVDVDPRWTFEHPEAIRAADGAWYLDAFNDQQVLARTVLERTSPRLGLEVELTVDHLELGAGFSVRLFDETGSVVLGTAVAGFGGGGFTHLSVTCNTHSETQRLRYEVLPKGWTERPVVARVERLDEPKRLVCKIGDGEETNWHHLPLEPDDQKKGKGRLTLVVSTDGDPTYHPPMRAKARLTRLRVHGVSWPRVEGDSRRAATAIVRGDFGNVDADTDPRLAAWAAVETGGPGVRAALAERWQNGDRQTLTWLLRRHEATVAPVLHELIGPSYFGLYHDAWYEALDDLWRADVKASLERAELDAMKGATVEAQKVMVVRARYFLSTNRAYRAEQLARLVVDRPARGAADAVHEAHLVLARTRARAKDREAAEAHVRTFLAKAASETIARDRVARIPELADLVR